MCLVENDYALFAELGRDILGDFRIKQVVEGENDNVEVWQLSVGLALLTGDVVGYQPTIRRTVK